MVEAMPLVPWKVNTKMKKPLRTVKVQTQALELKGMETKPRVPCKKKTQL